MRVTRCECLLHLHESGDCAFQQRHSRRFRLWYNAAMRSPFPGMDPYLEHPSLWPDVHNSLIVAIAHNLAARIAPRYYTRLRERTYEMESVISSLAINEFAPVLEVAYRPGARHSNTLIDTVDESYLEIHETATKTIVSVLELRSPMNKLHPLGRRVYASQHRQVSGSRTNLVEIDLLRAGQPMPTQGRRVESDYRILVSRATTRPRAHLYPFNLRDPIPTFPLPLLPGDDEPPVELGAIFHALYERARYDLSLDYSQPPVPPVRDEDATWAWERVERQE